jgi:epoxide hydrolase-like predicted phosphatase
VDRGEISPEEFSQKVADHTGSKVDKAIIRDISKHQFMRDFGLRTELVDLVDRLHHNGYKTGMLTNISSEPLHFQEVFRHFDTVVKSYKVHAVKPEPAAYYALLDGLGTEPQQTVFIDDIAENVDGANAVGILGILYQDSHQLMADLKKHHIQMD